MAPHRYRRVREQRRVAAGCAARNDVRRAIARCAGPVIDDDLVSRELRELERERPCGDVGRAAHGEADYHTHRLGWVLLRVGSRVGDHQRGETDEDADRIHRPDYGISTW